MNVYACSYHNVINAVTLIVLYGDVYSIKSVTAFASSGNTEAYDVGKRLHGSRTRYHLQGRRKCTGKPAFESCFVASVFIVIEFDSC